MNENNEPTIGDAVEQIAYGKMGVRTGDMLNEMVLDQEHRLAEQRRQAERLSAPGPHAGGASYGGDPIPGLIGSASGLGVGYWLATSTTMTWHWFVGFGIASTLVVAWLLNGPLHWVTRLVRAIVKLALILILLASVIWCLNAAGVLQ